MRWKKHFSPFAGHKGKKPIVVFLLAVLFICGVLLLIDIIDASRKRKKEAAVERWKGTVLVQTLQGRVRGFKAGEGVLSWQGVDFAAAPVGPLRWRSPRPVHEWTGIREAAAPGPEAIQYSPMGGKITGSEDCLHLNLWRREGAATGLPIYVWVHGGANASGSSAPGGDYDGANLARLSNFLFISLDYRLGPLGWFSDPDLVQAGTGGNLGLLDILAALAWIKENGLAFGGDPDNITLAGESAGASDILALLVCDRAKGMFKRAVLESPLNLFSSPAKSRERSRSVLCRALMRAGRAADAEAAGAYLDAMAPDAKDAFFLSMKAEELLNGLEPDSFGMYDWPSLIGDGAVLPADGMAKIASGAYPVKVPLIIGSNHDEVGIFLFMDKRQAALMPFYDEALAWGSASWNAWVEGLSARLARAAGQPPVRLYRFDWGSGAGPGPNPLPVMFRRNLGAFHSLEIPFFLGNDTVAGAFLSPLVFTQQNAAGRAALSSCMRAYVMDFAGGGKLAGLPGLPDWPSLAKVMGTGKGKGRENVPIAGLVFDADEKLARIRPYSLTAEARLTAIKKGLDEETISRMRELMPVFLGATLP